ncbi:N-(5'-phosphoribosyl)anthranilate isomerase [Neorhodopirellula pilleata]|uniref:N-(5'-phosphoribosyl)anthranilate isomerase n=2 Tax=Neorhodopirellula pilleata TaxID=2714738 RepID=A0A5C6AGF3_9BACT|nr:N-(5'-phosphoribosyl)anthranilate isomerase [Neorhodopirellula pilleata]
MKQLSIDIADKQEKMGGLPSSIASVPNLIENPILNTAHPPAPFKVKICGVRSSRDVQACADAGADAIGLNFYPASIRYVEPASESTKAINDTAKRYGICRVGLFVNHASDQVLEVARALDLDAIQFHGDETRADLRRALDAGFQVVRAIRLPTSPLAAEEIQSHLESLWDLPITFLLDADVGAAFGGGGKQLHWPSLADWASRYGRHATRGWVLAGGLDPACIAEAITQSTAKSVDVASGVESPRGQKSGDLIPKFVIASGLGGVDETGRLSETLPTAGENPTD